MTTRKLNMIKKELKNDGYIIKDGKNEKYINVNGVECFLLSNRPVYENVSEIIREVAMNKSGNEYRD